MASQPFSSFPPKHVARLCRLRWPALILSVLFTAALVTMITTIERYRGADPLWLGPALWVPPRGWLGTLAWSGIAVACSVPLLILGPNPKRLRVAEVLAVTVGATLVTMSLFVDLASQLTGAALGLVGPWRSSAQWWHSTWTMGLLPYATPVVALFWAVGLVAATRARHRVPTGVRLTAWTAVAAAYATFTLVKHLLDFRFAHVSTVELWTTTAAASLSTSSALVAWSAWRFRATLLPGFCAGCGYDLQGTRSERCPECGTPKLAAHA